MALQRTERLQYIDQVSRVPAVQQLRHTTANALKQGAVVGASAFAGGMLAGPLGMAAGAGIGTLISYVRSEYYQGVPRIIANMTEDERDQLAAQIQALVGSPEFQAFLAWIAIEANQHMLQEVFMQLTC